MSTSRRPVESVMMLPVRCLDETAAMAPKQRSGYVLLLQAQWVSPNGLLPADEGFLRAKSGLGDAWEGCRAAILARFEFADGYCADPDVRGEWFRERSLRERRAVGARRCNLARWGVGERGVSLSDAAGPATATRTAYDVAMDESKGSVTAREGREEEIGSKSSEPVAEIPQSGSREPQSADQAWAERCGVELGRMTGHGALISEFLPRVELESGDGQNQGAGTSSDVFGSLLEAPSASFSTDIGDFEGFVPDVDLSDEIAAMQLQASDRPADRPVARAHRSPSVGGRKPW